jgi:hypothetical protein
VSAVTLIADMPGDKGFRRSGPKPDELILSKQGSASIP